MDAESTVIDCETCFRIEGRLEWPHSGMLFDREHLESRAKPECGRLGTTRGLHPDELSSEFKYQLGEFEHDHGGQRQFADSDDRGHEVSALAADRDASR